jgi:hypothetical protein
MPYYEDREQKLRKSAYRLWVQAGRPPGREEEFRHLAKARMKEEEAVLCLEEKDQKDFMNLGHGRWKI